MTNTRNTENSLVHRTGAVFKKIEKTCEDHYHHNCHISKGSGVVIQQHMGDHARVFNTKVLAKLKWRGKSFFAMWLAMCGIKVITVDVVVNRIRRIRKLKQDMG